MGESKCFQWNMNRNNCCAIPSSLMFNTLLFIFSASHHCQTDTSGSLSHTRSLKPQKLLFFSYNTYDFKSFFMQDCNWIWWIPQTKNGLSYYFGMRGVHLSMKAQMKTSMWAFFKKQSSSNSFQLLVPVAFELRYKNSEMYLLPKASPFWLKIHIYIYIHIYQTF